MMCPSHLVSGAVEDTRVREATSRTVYIHDVLYVSLRAGPSTQHPMLRHRLKSGMKLQQFEKNIETGYSLVRTEDGREGWIQTQYLGSEPIAAEQLRQLKAEFNALQTQHQAALRRLAEPKPAATVINKPTGTKQESAGRLEKWYRLLANNLTPGGWLLISVLVILTSTLFGFWLGRRIYKSYDDGWV